MHQEGAVSARIQCLGGALADCLEMRAERGIQRGFKHSMRYNVRHLLRLLELSVGLAHIVVCDRQVTRLFQNDRRLYRIWGQRSVGTRGTTQNSFEVFSYHS